jgi:hypothetical protein
MIDAILGGAAAVAGLAALYLGITAFQHAGLIGGLRRLLAAAVFAVAALMLGGLLFLTRLFQAFAGETLVARVTARPLSPPAFELTYVPADGSPLIAVELQGDQWAVSGGLVKWHPWLAALGVKSYHKPIRLSGQFSSAAEHRRHLPSVHALEPVADRFWETLYWADPYLPFVEAVYGSSAYVYVESGAVHELYVTPSGYIIKRGKRL